MWGLTRGILYPYLAHNNVLLAKPDSVYVFDLIKVTPVVKRQLSCSGPLV